MKSRIQFALWLTVGSVISYFVFANYVVSVAEVEGASMEPTYHAGQKVFVNHLPLFWRNPTRGEVVVVYDEEIKHNVIKRIAGVPGDIYVGSNHLPQRWYYILGDNAAVSVDSRFYGPVLLQNIVGVVE